MWLTGFDAPTVSTLYLDKPQKNHTLMQTIARANRVTSWKINGVEKKNGEIIDYYGVFRNMKKALKDYGLGQDGEPPAQDKSALLKLLGEAVTEGISFCKTKGIQLEGLLESKDVFKNLEAFAQHADTLISKDEWRKGFFVHENTITGLYEACKPGVLGNPVVRKVAVFQCRQDEEKQASPIAYLERWHLHNELFGDRVRFLGALEEDGRLRLVIQQQASLSHCHLSSVPTPLPVSSSFPSWLSVRRRGNTERREPTGCKPVPLSLHLCGAKCWDFEGDAGLRTLTG
jgi:type I restriction enzyme R subunit